MDDEQAADQFCEEDIDQILQRRTQVITVESGVKGSTFAKATFATAGTRDDIALDDPDFWEKWAKKVGGGGPVRCKRLRLVFRILSW